MSGTRASLPSSHRRAADLFLTDAKRGCIPSGCVDPVHSGGEGLSDEIDSETAVAKVCIRDPDDAAYCVEEDDWQESETEEDPDNEPENLQLQQLRLHCCNVTQKACVQLMIVLKRAACLKTFVAIENGLNEIDCGLLVRTLLGNGVIQEITIVENGFGNASAILLAQSVAKMEMLPLEYVDLTSNCIKQAGAIAIGNMLCKPTKLRTLILAENHITEEGAHAIARGLSCNTTLKCLDVSGCGISHQGIAAIFESLHRNVSLCHLKVSNNPVESSLSTVLHSLVETNRGLTSLDAAEMGHGLHSITSLFDSEVIKHNPCLTSINFANNRLGDRGGIEFSTLLAEPGSSVKHLDLSGNRMGAPTGWALLEALGKGNHALESICLDANNFGVDTLLIIGQLKRFVKEVRYTIPDGAVVQVPTDGYGGCCSGTATDEAAAGNADLHHHRHSY